MQSVTAVKTLYTYDANGNMTRDDINRTSSIKYDHRNLMTEIRVIKTEAPTVFDPPVDVLYLTYYRYDEAGNSVRKKRYKYNGSDPDPVFVTEGSNPSWALQSDEYYVRDVSGKEIAIYSGSSLTQWNIWGLDNVGKINADTTRNYYLKDHLGSIRVVLNSTNTVVSAQDYDAWGYPLQNRTYNSSAMKYDFTGKERDNETSYDYFGARYYDSRIGRWGQVEPLLDKYVNISPYCYSINNPINSYDPNGKDPRRKQMANLSEIVNSLEKHKGEDLFDFVVSVLPGNDSKRYVYTEVGGFIDLMHFFAAAVTTSKILPLDPFGGPIAEHYGRELGEFTEIFQTLKGDDSQWDPEDMPSNSQGAEFGVQMGINNKITDDLSEKFTEYMNKQKILDKDDPSISRDKIRIREDENDTPLPNRFLDLDPYRPYRGESIAAKGNLKQ
ncbi:MAG TPA: RHS repeat-associated core domain-containing protein [Ignavibacteria bacterium]|nr:RHS repeat-associated core domain-containing protein [Ignavibacteria bacterium]